MATAQTDLPLAMGVPAHPEIPGSEGCLRCDFSGTLEGYRKTQRLENEAHECFEDDGEEWTLDL